MAIPVTLRRVAYTLQELQREELERLQRQQMIVPLGVNEILEWSNGFVLLPKVNGKV